MITECLVNALGDIGDLPPVIDLSERIVKACVFGVIDGLLLQRPDETLLQSVLGGAGPGQTCSRRIAAGQPLTGNYPG